MVLVVTIAAVETDDTDDAPDPQPRDAPTSLPTTEAGAGEAQRSPVPTIDTADRLDLIEGDLADVEVALARLDTGTYWVDEVTGADLPAELLTAHPTARRVPEA